MHKSTKINNTLKGKTTFVSVTSRISAQNKQ